MRKIRRLQSAQVLALVGICAARAAAPGLALAQAPATPNQVPPPPPAAPVAAPPSTTPLPPSAAGQPAPATAAPAAPAEPPPPPGAFAAPPAAEPGQPAVPEAAEPTAPPAYVEPITAPAEPPMVEAAPTIDEQLVAEPKSKVPSYVMWGVGGASLITGAVLGITALKAKSDFDSDPTYSAADRVEGRAVAADIAFGLSAVLLVTGTVFYFLPDSQESRPTASNPKRTTTARIQVAPMLGRTNGGAVSIQF